MIAPDSASILDVWERGLHQPLQRKVIALLAAVSPGSSDADIAALPLGTRDAMLLDLRERLFGPDLATIATCPQCGERLEAGFAIDDIRVPPPDPSDAEGVVTVGTNRIRFRVPNTADLLAAAEHADPAAAHRLLLERCLIEAHDSNGRPVVPAALPPVALPAISAQMARADPGAVVDLAFVCPACGTAFEAVFDVASFLIKEIHAWAQQMLRDIHSLARAFGWREADILALSPTRRRLYLDMVAR